MSQSWRSRRPLKPIVRTILAFAAGAGLTLLLLLIFEEAPPAGPEPPGAPEPAPLRSTGRITSAPPPNSSRAPRPGPQGSPAHADAEGQAAVSGAVGTEVQETPTGPAPAAAIVVVGARYQAKAGSKVRIEGTSNVHDWQVEGNIIGGHLEVGASFPADPATAALGEVEAEVQVSIPSRSLKSVTPDGLPFNAQMDAIMYGLLLEPTCKAIRYTLGGLTLTNVPSSADEPFVFISRGELMVAGVTNSITMPVLMTVLPDDRLRFSGSLSARMTDFGIMPPEPFGLGIKTGDDVKLIFDWIVGRKQP